ncbi:polysaccharide biosynthesis/export family protein [Flavobacterium sp. NKUCC04_CG]|uniref:polysaccharide biosynthesis/export family protein n=1 Tax=Flavobacterium sp. NKUCC04_CG TaxID=2842121 RepID=UPI001C5AC9C5|nr:polysaccharide biosynthesis/export family protein [Flavobacterium sp. NKUCC04_CG]MBW3519326.1 polysaccharide biosynthesis/export family protein [Flavobacterium sp. NKUCC04_CG]
MTKISLTYLLLLFAMLALSSCASKNKYLYYQDIEEVINSESQSKLFETKLAPDDLLMIIVSAEDPESAAPFNLFSTMTADPKNPARNGQMTQQLYLVDSQGKIEFPIVGSLIVGGLTKSQAIALIKDEINKYLTNPIVNLRIMNFKITVQGEVNRPGVHSIISERLTLPEAITLSGDLSTYGSRKNIMIIREQDGKRSFARVDITKADFINSPYYFLRQNDIVYVEPNKTKINSSVVGPNITIGISALSLLVTIIALSLK